jgi:hypothetical protein
VARVWGSAGGVGSFRHVNTNTTIKLFGWSRAALGVWLALNPRLPATVWYSDRHLTPAVTALTRSVGIRDIGLGLGLAADPVPGSNWLKAGITVDIVDALAPVLIRRDIPKSNLITGVVGALAYAVLGFVLARRR